MLNRFLVRKHFVAGGGGGGGGSLKAYATLDPNRIGLNHTLSNGNLTVTNGNLAWKSTFCTAALPATGVYYWEVTKGAGAYHIIGFGNHSASTASYVGDSTNSLGWYDYGNDIRYNAATVASIGTYATNDVIGVKVDMDARSYTFYKNGTQIYTNTMPVNLQTGPIYPAISLYDTGAAATFNFGATAFANTPVGITGGVDNLTALLIHFNGGNGSATFTDSATGKPLTSSGCIQQTGTVKFGSSACNITSVNGHTITGVASNDLILNGDFTIEYWANSSVLNNTAGGFHIAKSAAAQKDMVEYYGGAWSVAGSTSVSLNNVASSLPVGVWKHIAVTRQGTTLRLFIDGALIATDAACSQAFFNSTTVLWLCGGYQPNNAYQNKEYIDELRIVKGAALYTTNFTPPTAEFSVL